LADFTYVLTNWINGGVSGIADLTAHGVPTMAEFVAEYCRLTGRPGIDNLDWYLAYNLFRLAAILQGIAGRVRDGTANSPQALANVARIPGLASLAWEYAVRAGAK
jgi:aminoglycoside phosphotransferase (APT) family kinase protein